MSSENSVVLPFGNGLVAFAMPAEHVRRTSLQLTRDGLEEPPVIVDDCGGEAVFLAEFDGAVIGQFEVPAAIRCLMASVGIELPPMDLPASARPAVVPVRELRPHGDRRGASAPATARFLREAAGAHRLACTGPVSARSHTW